MSDTQTLTAARTPTVYFIDDSATMREVIKIAFRKENIHVITCADAASALAQFGETAPDAVITDVIMPDKDGYEVCQFIKQHEQLRQHARDSDVRRGESHRRRKSDGGESRRTDSQAVSAAGSDHSREESALSEIGCREGRRCCGIPSHIKPGIE